MSQEQPQAQPQERRAHYRMACGGDGDLVIRIWPIAADDLVPKEPKPGAAATTTPVDISAGGMGLLITPQEYKRLHLDRGTLIGAWVQRKDVSVIVHGEIRRTVTRADGLIRLGVSVELRETSLQRRRAILKFEALSATIHRIELEVLSRFGRPAAG
jgi:hypothetical protein